MRWLSRRRRYRQNVFLGRKARWVRRYQQTGMDMRQYIRSAGVEGDDILEMADNQASQLLEYLLANSNYPAPLLLL